MPSLFSHPYQLDESISNFRAVGRYFSFLIQIFKEISVHKQWKTRSDAVRQPVCAFREPMNIQNIIMNTACNIVLYMGDHDLNF